MRLFLTVTAACLLVPLAAGAQQKPTSIVRWVDDEGVIHYGDSVPPEYADKPKQVLNDQGVTVRELEGKKTEEQLAAEREAEERELARELQARKDRSLLLTYQTIEEIEMHRDRRVELFQAQARVTELYLRNLNRRLGELKNEAGRYKPYSSDPEAPTVDPGLVEEIKETESAIERHESNLDEFRQQEQNIIERFNKNIDRFRELKGMAAEPKPAADAQRIAQAVPE